MDDLKPLSRRERVLNLWAEGKITGDIVAAIPGETAESVSDYVQYARKLKDPRAAKRGRVSPHSVYFDMHGEEVLDLWAAGELTVRQIGSRFGIERESVQYIIDRARGHHDKRAAPRRYERPGAIANPESLLSESIQVYGTDCVLFSQPIPVSIPKIDFGRNGERRPMGFIMERGVDRRSPQALTRSLMGDPEPGRSALGREVQPHEYASKPGQGRWRDPMLGVASGNGWLGSRR